MRTGILFTFLIAGSTMLFSQDIMHMNYNGLNSGNTEGLGFSLLQKDLDDLTLATEIAFNLIDFKVDGESTTNGELIFDLGPHYNINFSDESIIVPYIGASVGVGYFFRDETLVNYTGENLENLESNIENGEELPPDGIFFYYDATIGLDFLIFGRYKDAAAGGINIAYKFGYYERLSIGFTAPFHLW